AVWARRVCRAVPPPPARPGSSDAAVLSCGRCPSGDWRCRLVDERRIDPDWRPGPLDLPEAGASMERYRMSEPYGTTGRPDPRAPLVGIPGTRRPAIVLVALVFAAGAAAARGASPDEGVTVEFFEKKVRPILVEHCHACHSAETKPAGGLRVDDRNGLL